MKYFLEKGGEMIDLRFTELTIRILLAIVFGGMVGYEREAKGQSAGFRTHILVCIGATLIALIQIRATNEVLNLAAGTPDFLQILSIDNTRLTAQIVSGIGFLGAGTIIVTKRSISGLTTAASIWTTANIGIALGMGFYDIAVIGGFIILVTLTVIKKKLNIAVGEHLVVRYVNEEAQKKIISYFKEQNISCFSAEFRMENNVEKFDTVYTEHFTLNISSRNLMPKIVQDVGRIDSVIYASSQRSVS